MQTHVIKASLVGAGALVLAVLAAVLPILTLGNVALALGAAVLALTAHRMALAPLDDIIASAQDIAGGEHYRKVPHRKAHGKPGRVGDLAGSIENLRKALIEADAAVAEQEADREHQEQRRGAMESFIAKFGETINSVQQSVDAAAQTMREAATGLVGSSETVSERSSRIDDAASSTTQEAAALAEAAGQLDASLHDIETRVHHATGALATAVEMVEKSSETIRGLAEAANGIDTMAGVINGIAGATRMLALNATIEAARAEEAGKGFAVVAAEVKNLVGDTEQATADIAARTSEIGTAVAGAMTATDAISTAIHDIDGLVAAVAAAIAQQSAASHAISASVQTTANEAESVSTGIRDVASASHLARKGARSVRDAAEGLATQSDALRTAVSTFLDDLDHGSIRIGILHSLSGGSAVGERPLKDVLLMEVKALNARGGLLGRPVEALLYNPRSSSSRTAELAEKALGKDRVQALFGCWSSTSRKATIPVLEKHGGLLFYPSQYEGAEQSPNIVYAGAPPNQQLLPAVEHLMTPTGGGFRRFFLIGNDTLYPQMTHRVLRDFLVARGVPDTAIGERCLPVGADDWSSVSAEVRAFAKASDDKTLVVSTVGGDSNFSFFRDIAAARTPILTVSIGEAEAALMDPSVLAGHMVAWNYLMNVDTQENRTFLRDWRAYSGREDAVVNDAMESSVLAFRLWVAAVEKAGSYAPKAVRAALPGLSVRSLTGFDVVLDPLNGHLHKPAMVGRIAESGKIDIIWRSRGLIAPEPGGLATKRSCSPPSPSAPILDRLPVLA